MDYVRIKKYVIYSSLIPSPSLWSFYLKAMHGEKLFLLYGCEINTGVGRTGNAANLTPQIIL